jgi:periplasmic divalent cation tolerance protein
MSESDEVCQVTITAPDAEWLASLVHELVERRLCASGHISTPIRSIYRWKSEVYDKPETLVALHTRREHFDAISQYVVQRHPYEVPCVVATPIVDVNPAYADWIIAETSAGAA